MHTMAHEHLHEPADQADAATTAQQAAAATRPVLVVSSDRGFADEVTAALAAGPFDGAVTCVPDDLHALGQIGTGGRPELLITRRDDLGDDLQESGAALRELAPRTRLLLVGRSDAGSGAVQALAAGFDDFLTEPLDVQTLGQTLRRHLQGNGNKAARRPARSDPAAQPDEAGGDAQRTSATLPDIGGSPGDVDLIEQILQQRGPVRELAMQMLTERSGIAGLGWRSDAATQATPGETPGEVAVPVTYSGHPYGVLHAPGGTPADLLEPWAAWLARWLALEQRMTQLWDMALRDELTGAWNRRYFQRFLKTALDRAQSHRFRVTLMVFDIDDFKIYNDRYGHAAGDDILRESARLMKSVVRDHDVVARIGGDEFAVIFWDAEAPRRPNSDHPSDVSLAAKRFQRAICEHKFPKLLDEAPGNLTISGGLASFPWDGRTADELLDQADRMAMHSKRQGKNAITFGPGALKACATLENQE